MATRANGMREITQKRANATVDPRHRSLRATLDWSYDMLTLAERQLSLLGTALASGTAVGQKQPSASGCC